VRDMLEDFLRRSGYTPRVAADGPSGLRAIQEDPPSVVLLDIHLPELDGLAVLQAIRAIGFNTQVIVLSGTTDESLSRRALAYGAATRVVAILRKSSGFH
jgi:DNA-binding response OmpR family regulator